MKKTFSRPDYILILTVATLLFFGLLILISASAPISQEKFGNPYYFLKHQIIFGLIPGFLLAFLAIIIPLNLIKKWVPLLLLVNLILLGIVFLPGLGVTFGGATRWLSLGKITFQPSEFLKLTFILYLASWLASRTEKIKTIAKRREFTNTLIAFLIIIGTITLLLIFQPHLSILVIIATVGTLMYFLSGTPLWHTILILLTGIGGVFSLIKLAPYRMERWTVFLRPETDPLGMGYQLKQSLVAVGSGGILGLGLGYSRQKFGFLPQAFSDSIFAVLSEETGFVGSLILIFLFLIFLWRVFKTSRVITDKFSKLAVVGISLWITLQAFVNIGAMIGILPLTGVPLPFIGYGGSHLIVELTAVGILFNIFKQET